MAPCPIPVANKQVTLGGGSTGQAGEGLRPSQLEEVRGAPRVFRSPTSNPCPVFWPRSSQDVTLLLEGCGVALTVLLTSFPKDPSSPHTPDPVPSAWRSVPRQPPLVIHCLRTLLTGPDQGALDRCQGSRQKRLASHPEVGKTVFLLTVL